MAIAILQENEKRLGRVVDELAALEEQLEDAEDELTQCADRISEIEGEIYSLKKSRAELQKDYAVTDISPFLATPMKQQGYRLIELLAKIPHPQMQIPLFPYTEPAEIFRWNILEDCYGQVVKQWERPASLTDVLEAR